MKHYRKFMDSWAALEKENFLHTRRDSYKLDSFIGVFKLAS